ITDLRHTPRQWLSPKAKLYIGTEKIFIPSHMRRRKILKGSIVAYDDISSIYHAKRRIGRNPLFIETTDGRVFDIQLTSIENNLLKELEQRLGNKMDEIMEKKENKCNN
ncbi:MAG: hypothetical protein KAU14_04250, partial [Thermoplasmata archaeon]|nr:hypothetical protein [Thermoplasmata archaeon]